MDDQRQVRNSQSNLRAQLAMARLEISSLKSQQRLTIQSANACMGRLLEQVYQMQGMFDDKDGAIASAVEEAENWTGELS